MKVNSFSMSGDKAKWSSGFAANIRQHFTLYWDDSWAFWIYTDHELGDEGYCPVLKKLAEEGLIKVIVVPDEGKLYQKRLRCTMMLWRMLPIWENTEYVFCRDSDSILTPRQLQCVRSFISSRKAVHGITDNVSHCIPLMGGMCGFHSPKFLEAMRSPSLNAFMTGIYTESGYTRFGYDQDFLMNAVWPHFQSSVLIHHLGGPNDRSANKIVTDAYMEDIPQMVREKGDDFTNYIGASGCSTSRGYFSSLEICDFYNEYGNVKKCKIITDIEKNCGWR